VQCQSQYAGLSSLVQREAALPQGEGADLVSSGSALRNTSLLAARRQLLVGLDREQQQDVNGSSSSSSSRMQATAAAAAEGEVTRSNHNNENKNSRNNHHNYNNNNSSSSSSSSIHEKQRQQTSVELILSPTSVKTSNTSGLSASCLLRFGRTTGFLLLL